MSNTDDLMSNVESLRSALTSSGGIYTNYILFTMDNLKLSTDNNHGYILSLTNNRNGTGAANSFTLTIAYAPSYYDIETFDPNKIDKAIYNSPTKECTLQYGYSYPSSIVSPEYKGLVLNYSVDVREGILTYTITGISGIASETESKITTPRFDAGTRGTEICRQIFDQFLKEQTGYTFEFGKNTEGTDVPRPEPTEVTSDTTAIQFIQSILNECVYENDNDDTPEYLRSIYYFEIDDSKKIFRVVRNYPNENIDNSNPLEFNWGGKDENLVVSFQAEFQGSVLMAASAAEQANAKDEKAGITSSGEMEDSQMGYSPTTGDSISGDISSVRNFWASAMQYTYSASITTVGLPFHIDILTKLKIVPMIYGKAHHSQGIYSVLKITDQIDQSGFITSMDLIKCTDPGKTVTNSGGAGSNGKFIGPKQYQPLELQATTVNKRSTPFSDVIYTHTFG